MSCCHSGRYTPMRSGSPRVIAGWAFYQGWLTRRNGWSVRESIFQHVWYDVMAILLELGDARQVTVGLSLPLSF